MNEKIFITLGSQKFQFNRLLIAVDKLCEKKVISGEDVFAQTGYSDYVPRNYSYNNFLDTLLSDGAYILPCSRWHVQYKAERLYLLFVGC